MQSCYQQLVAIDVPVEDCKLELYANVHGRYAAQAVSSFADHLRTTNNAYSHAAEICGVDY